MTGIRRADQHGIDGRLQRRRRLRPQRRRGRVLAARDDGLARVDPGGGQPVRRQRGRDDAAADDLAGGGDRVEPARRDFAQHAERADDALELVELRVDERLDVRALGRVR